jgi:2-hydroxychromene-2-carboxylate isomerase
MNRVVDFYFDFASPFSYLADCRIDAALADLDVEVHRRPFYLRGLDKFRGGVPFEGQKLRYLGLDLARQSKRWGVPFQLPSHFPVNGLHALRAWIARGSDADVRRELFRATWVQDQNVSDPAVVAAITGVTSITDEVKAALKQSTDEAMARGVFGLPAFLVGEELFWGHDSIDTLRWFLESS